MDACLNIAQQAKLERSLRTAILLTVTMHADDGLPSERIVEVMREALDREVRLLEEQRANERSY